MTSVEYKKFLVSLKTRAIIGAVGGLVGGFAIFLIIFIIDGQLGTVPGTFYKVVGIPIGLQETSATIFGMIAHMLTASLIGTVFCYCSGIHRKLELTSYKKGILAGTISSTAVYAIFFIPITFVLIFPALELSTHSDQGLITTITNIDSLQLVKNTNLIIWGSLEIHLLYGAILGLFCSMALQSNIKNTNNLHGLKTIAIGIIIGTAAIGIYYSTIQSLPDFESSNQISTELGKLESGLTYRHFIEMNENEQRRLVAKMPSSTINLILDEAKKSNTQIFEDTSLITAQLESIDDLKYLQTTQIQNIKGFDGKGKITTISAGDKTFLRFEGLSVTNGPSLFVYLTKAGDIDSGFNIGKLKANQGNFNYDITGIDTFEYNVVAIYSIPLQVYYASANLPVE